MILELLFIGLIILLVVFFIIHLYYVFQKYMLKRRFKEEYDKSRKGTISGNTGRRFSKQVQHTERDDELGERQVLPLPEVSITKGTEPSISRTSKASWFKRRFKK